MMFLLIHDFSKEGEECLGLLFFFSFFSVAIVEASNKNEQQSRHEQAPHNM